MASGGSRKEKERERGGEREGKGERGTEVGEIERREREGERRAQL